MKQFQVPLVFFAVIISIITFGVVMAKMFKKEPWHGKIGDMGHTEATTMFMPVPQAAGKTVVMSYTWIYIPDSYEVWVANEWHSVSARTYYQFKVGDELTGD